ncbi:MAG: hypothetical protein WBI83_08715 [bacterium]|jgi:hypothetical protein
MVERGVYDLATWVAGMKYLPEVVETPPFFRELGFAQIPAGPQEVRDRYRNLAKKIMSPEGGDQEELEKVKQAAEQALKYFEKMGR